jgi:hypothetical protein
MNKCVSALEMNNNRILTTINIVHFHIDTNRLLFKLIKSVMYSILLFDLQFIILCL